VDRPHERWVVIQWARVIGRVHAPTRSSPGHRVALPSSGTAIATDLPTLAAQLAAAAETESGALVASVAQFGVPLAQALKDHAYTAWSSDPAQARGAAAALTTLADLNPHPVITALSAWTSGIAALTTGQMENAIACFDAAAFQFQSLDEHYSAAATQVPKLMALAMLGRTDEALFTGLQARAVFVAQHDPLAAGRVELNLGMIALRRDRYAEAEQFFRAAEARFRAAGDQENLLKAANNLGLTLTYQHHFAAAEQLYRAALAEAEQAGLGAVQAEVERNLGALAMFQGRYDQALSWLERCRRHYEALDIPHELALAEYQLAEAYLELNLAPEAAAILSRVVPAFAALDMPEEYAWGLIHWGRASFQLGDRARAQTLLNAARSSFDAATDSAGAGISALTAARLQLATGDPAGAANAAAFAEQTFTTLEIWEWALLARWLRAEAMRVVADAVTVRDLLQTTLTAAAERNLSQVVQRCQTSLGLLAAAQGNVPAAEAALNAAIEITEQLRAGLPAEEFRTAFLADKLTPYIELARLSLAAGTPERNAAALLLVERARSRALAEALATTGVAQPRPHDPAEAGLQTHHDNLRAELNGLYARLKRTYEAGAAGDDPQVQALQEAIRTREHDALETERRRHLSARTTTGLSPAAHLDLPALQAQLGDHTALVEYFTLDNELLAFVVTDAGISVVRNLAVETEVEAAITQLRFQTDALRHGTERMRAHMAQLTRRANHYLGRLHSLLLAPLQALIGTRRLVVVPYRSLHYVPFHALYTGTEYVVDQREVSYAPSATVLLHCIRRQVARPERALLIGVPDERTPRVEAEITTLATLFAQPTVLTNAAASAVALRAGAPQTDLLHLACHGRFRPDSPLFSALHLADGWFTVGDAYSLDLERCGLVVLSACETGVSAIAPGDELIGLARGFFAAGAPSLIVSLWTVDDAGAADLMRTFYERLSAGERPAAAIRSAQLAIRAAHPHPFFWSPFVLLGRW
jgi:CHAT domain-containing protein